MDLNVVLQFILVAKYDLYDTKFAYYRGTMHTPTKRSNAQHLVEYYKQFLQEENQKSGNVMQKTMHSYVCGKNLRSESSLVLSDLHFA